MKKNYPVLLLIFCFCTTVLHAQYDAKTDSKKLLKELAQAKQDTAKIRIMVALGHFYTDQSYVGGMHKSIDTAFAFAQKSERLSNAIQYKKGLANTYMLYSNAYNLERQYDKSEAYANKAIAVATSLGDKEMLCSAYSSLFWVVRYVRSNDEKIKIAKKVLLLAKQSGNNLLIADSYYDLAESVIDLHESLGYLEAALKYYKAAKEERVQKVYSFMASLYTSIGQQDNALRCIIKAVDLIDKYNDKSYFNMTIYCSAGSAYREMGKYDKALGYFKKADGLSKKYNDLEYNVFIKRNLIQTFVLLKRYDEAQPELDYIEKTYNNKKVRHPYREMSIVTLLERYTALKNAKKANKYYSILKASLAQQPNDSPVLGAYYMALAKYYFYKREYNNSKKHTIIFTDIVKIDKRKNKLEEAYRLLFKIDSAQANYPDALKYAKIANLYRDSIFNETKNKQLAELEIQYEVEKKDKDNLLLKKQAELQQSKLSDATKVRNLSLVGILLSLIIAALIFRQFKINQKIRKQTNLKNITLQSLLTEKEWLLKEIHHRVKNNLQIVMSLLNTQSHFLNDDVAKEAIKSSQQRIHSMSLIHKKLYQDDDPVSVNMEVYILELIEYFKISFDTQQRIQFVVNVEPIALHTSQAVPLGLIVNEVISNAIKHAFPNGKEGVIEIALHTSDDKIILSIKDNGISTSKDLNEADFPSLGIKMIKGFSRELNAKVKFCNKEGLMVYLEFANSKLKIAG